MNAIEAEKDFLDLVYGAAIEPDLWSDVLGRLSTILGGSESHLGIQDEAACTGTFLSAGADPLAGQLYINHFIRCNPLLETRDLPPALRVMTDEQKLPKREFVRTEFYNDHLRHFDLHSLLILRLALSLPFTTTITVCRPARREPFGQADVRTARRIQPHLIRAYRLAERFRGMVSLQGTREALLELSAHGVFVLNGKGIVRYANRAAEALMAGAAGLGVTNGILRTASPDSTRKLHALIAAASEPDAERRSGGTMAIVRSGRRPLSITVAPIRVEQSPLFGMSASVLVSVSDPETEIEAPPKLLRDLFGFTPAEARVAGHLLAGCDPREAANRMGVSYYTVRAHLVRMFDKTATNRQAELVSLLMRSTLSSGGIPQQN